MRKCLSILVILAIVLIAGCRKVCENVKVGDADYSAEAQAFFNYKQGDLITFTSASGDEITFTVNVLEEKFFICQKVTCDPLDPYKSSYCEYIESPQNSVFLNSDSTLLGFTIGIQAYEPESDLLYEYVKFTISHVNDSAEASYITDVRFETPTFDKETITDIEEYVKELASVELNNKTYNDVLVCADDKLALIYQKGEGFVGLSIGNVSYWLK